MSLKLLIPCALCSSHIWLLNLTIFFSVVDQVSKTSKLIENNSCVFCQRSLCVHSLNSFLQNMCPTEYQCESSVQINPTLARTSRLSCNTKGNFLNLLLFVYISTVDFLFTKRRIRNARSLLRKASEIYLKV